MCVFMRLHVTVQSDPVLLVILSSSDPHPCEGGIKDCCQRWCVYVRERDREL